MSWIDRVRNSLPFTTKRDTPDNLWVKCPSCKEMLFTKEYEDNLSVCPRCEHHGRIGADARFAQLLDAGFEILPSPKVKEDPLKFRDSKKYPDRLKAARLANPHPDALTNALGKIGGHKKPRLSGETADWLRTRCRSGPFTTRGLTAELLVRGIRSDRRSVWLFLHAQGLSFKKNRAASRTDPT